jgi:hypothetical protein
VNGSVFKPTSDKHRYISTRLPIAPLVSGTFGGRARASAAEIAIAATNHNTRHPLITVAFHTADDCVIDKCHH